MIEDELIEFVKSILSYDVPIMNIYYYFDCIIDNSLSLVAVCLVMQKFLIHINWLNEECKREVFTHLLNMESLS